MREMTNRPLIGLTMGDVAGIGPEVIARAGSFRGCTTWPDRW